jgi:1-deoxy-D-xylulose-5-phosphate synthase
LRLNIKAETNRQHVAVIGDGTVQNVFEALNHAGIENSNLLVIFKRQLYGY